MLPFAVCLEGDEMWPTLGSWILETWGSCTAEPAGCSFWSLKRGKSCSAIPVTGKAGTPSCLLYLYILTLPIWSHRAWRHSMSCVPNLSVSCVPICFLIHGPMLNDFCFYFPWWSGQRIRITLWKWKLLDPKGEQGLWEPDTQLKEQGVPKPRVLKDLECILTHPVLGF